MIIKAIFLTVLSFSLSGLAKDTVVGKTTRERREDKTKGHLLAEPIFTTSKKKNETAGMGVNAYLWKASVETVSFLPKKSLDPFGGTIITEWYSAPEFPQERLKIEIVITGRALISDGIKVSIFRERKNNRGEWISASVDPETPIKFEETILSRARELKVAEEIE